MFAPEVRATLSDDSGTPQIRANAAANVFVEKDVTFCGAMFATYLTNVPTGNVVAGGSGGAVVDVDAFATRVGRSDDVD